MILSRGNYHNGCSSPIRYGVKSWYDNEWGYSNRCVDLAIFIGQKMTSGKGTAEKANARA